MRFFSLFCCCRRRVPSESYDTYEPQPPYEPPRLHELQSPDEPPAYPPSALLHSSIHVDHTNHSTAHLGPPKYESAKTPAHRSITQASQVSSSPSSASLAPGRALSASTLAYSTTQTSQVSSSVGFSSNNRSSSSNDNRHEDGALNAKDSSKVRREEFKEETSKASPSKSQVGSSAPNSSSPAPDSADSVPPLAHSTTQTSQASSSPSSASPAPSPALSVPPSARTTRPSAPPPLPPITTQTQPTGTCPKCTAPNTIRDVDWKPGSINTGRPWRECSNDQCQRFNGFADDRGLGADNPLCWCAEPASTRLVAKNKRDGLGRVEAFFSCRYKACSKWVGCVDGAGRTRLFTRAELEGMVRVGQI